MMEKDQAVAKLKEKGYNAYLSSNVVMIRYPIPRFEQNGASCTEECEDRIEIYDSIKKMLRNELGYDRSFGIIFQMKGA